MSAVRCPAFFEKAVDDCGALSEMSPLAFDATIHQADESTRQRRSERVVLGIDIGVVRVAMRRQLQSQHRCLPYGSCR